jgi:splicing factor 3B subunit 3
VDSVPGALCSFQGRLLAGVGHLLRIYDLGKRKLLRKCETKLLPTFVKTIHTTGDRIMVGDLSESFHYLKYKKTENQFYVFADDTAPRWVTSATLLDYDTIAGGDKFGNVFVCRLPLEVSEEIEDDPTGAKLKLGQGILNGAPYKVDEIIQFHVGEVVTSLAKASLLPGGSPSLLYSTTMGSIGALFPFLSREDVDFFSHLEMHMRQEKPPLCGRDHLGFRSYYFPVKDVIDGDLCEQFAFLDLNKQRSIAEELDRTPSEVLKKLEDIRNLIL